MDVYAQIKNGQPTGVHRSFATAPQATPTESWGLVVYGTRNPPHDPVTQTVVPQRTLNGDGTVTYEEVVEALPLETVKVRKLKALQAEYDALLAQGYPVPDADYALALEKDDRNAFTSWTTNVLFALQNGLLTNESPTVLADRNRRPHPMTVGEALTILVGYGAFYQTTWQRIANANAAIQDAADQAAVLAVTL